MITGRSSQEFSELVEGTSTAPARSASYGELLELVGALRAVPDPVPDPAFAGALRERLVTEARTVLREAADQRLVTEARLRLRERPAPVTPARRRRRAAAAVTGVVLVGTTASMAVAAQSALPGDTLYPLKRGIESVHAQLTFDRAARGRVLLDSASTRLDEVQRLAAEGADASQVGETLGAFSEEAVAGADVLVADYQATGDESSITTLRTFTATSMARLRDLQQTVPPGAVDDVLRAAQALDQVQQTALQTCPTCAGPLITAMPPVLARSLQAAADSWRVADPPGGRHGPHSTSAGGIDLPQVGGDLPPASVTDPGQSGLEPTADTVRSTLQHLAGDLSGDQQPDLGSTLTDTSGNLLDAVGAVGNTVSGTLDGTGGLVPSDPASDLPGGVRSLLP